MPTITERTLRQWRVEALQSLELLEYDALQGEKATITLTEFASVNKQLRSRILRLTMELLDIRLLERMKGRKSR